MALYVPDTDTCIYWLKGDEEVDRRIVSCGLRHTAITVITECELFYGALKSLKADKNLAAITELRKKVRALHTSDGVAYQFGTITSNSFY